VSVHASPADIRSAFLQLTKTFHPAKFARMSSQIQKLSNEVFLSLRAAHEQIVNAKPPPAKPSGRQQSTTNIPITKQPATTRPFGVPITGSQPVVPATRPGVPGTGRMPAEAKPVERQPTQPLPTVPKQPLSANPPGPAGPAVRPTPAPASVQIKPTTPTTSRPSQPGGTIRFPTVAKTPTAQSAPIAAPDRSSSSGQALDPALAAILQLMGMGQWDAAQAAVDSLATKNPQNKKYAALAAYARGRRAQLEGNLRIAQIELNDAMTLDPDLDVAKSAFAELYKPRK
jgi:hypothetical protein